MDGSINYDLHFMIEIKSENAIVGPFDGQKFKREITDYLKTIDAFPIWPWPKMQKLVGFGNGKKNNKVIISFKYKTKEIGEGVDSIDQTIVKKITAKYFASKEQGIHPIEELKEINLEEIETGIFYTQFTI